MNNNNSVTLASYEIYLFIHTITIQICHQKTDCTENALHKGNNDDNNNNYFSGYFVYYIQEVN